MTIAPLQRWGTRAIRPKPYPCSWFRGAHAPRVSRPAPSRAGAGLASATKPLAA